MTFVMFIGPKNFRFYFFVSNDRTIKFQPASLGNSILLLYQISQEV
jgi:hypothetical protein